MTETVYVGTEEACEYIWAGLKSAGAASWLMGLPCWWTNIEWSSCAAREMQLYLCRQRTLLHFLLAAQCGDGE